jgi:hypothetical protein
MVKRLAQTLGRRRPKRPVTKKGPVPVKSKRRNLPKPTDFFEDVMQHVQMLGGLSLDQRSEAAKRVAELYGREFKPQDAEVSLLVHEMMPFRSYPLDERVMLIIVVDPHCLQCVDPSGITFNVWNFAGTVRAACEAGEKLGPIGQRFLLEERRL